MNQLFQIKICGITTPTDASMVCQSGADAIGLNFCSQSSRFLDSVAAGRISSEIDRFNANMIQKIWKVGVFVDAPELEIVDSVAAYQLDAVQFHGCEMPDSITKIRKLLSKRRLDCKLIRAIRVRVFPDSADFEQKKVEIDKVQAEIEIWETAGIDAILLDSNAAGEFGGSGKTLDWNFVPQWIFSVPVILAGGLKPENVATAIQIAKVQSVDVASGVESTPGEKDTVKVQSFVRNTGWRG